MIAIMSPAKSLKEYSAATVAHPLTTPASSSYKRLALVEKVLPKSVSQVGSAMGISAMLAAGVVGFYQAMAMTVHQDQDQDPGDTSKADKADKAAACSALYDGPAFKALDVGSLAKKDMTSMQSHLRIVSALYGLLKPCDAIQKYRMCFDYKEFDCYAHWGDALAREVLSDLQAQQALLSGESGDEGKGKGKGKGKGETALRPLVCNVASEEYSKAVLPPLRLLPDCPADLLVIRFQFLTAGKQPSVYGKAGRGLMARWIATQGVRSSSASDLTKAFNYEGYAFSAASSSEELYVYTRASAPAPKAKAKAKAKAKGTGKTTATATAKKRKAED